MPAPSAAFDKATTLIDTANSEDPNQESEAGKTWPKELLYSRRMTDMIERFAPNADEAMHLAVRAQHVQRWKSPRDAYPMDRKGYHQWRSALYDFHADTAGELLAQAGYSTDFIERVKRAVAKKSLKSNPDAQLVEDVSVLVFIEHYMADFAQRHPDYDEEKWLNIIRRTWNKLSEPAQRFALSGARKLPAALVPLIQKAIAD